MPEPPGPGVDPGQPGVELEPGGEISPIKHCIVYPSPKLHSYETIGLVEVAYSAVKLIPKGGLPGAK